MYIKGDKLDIIKADKQSIGYKKSRLDYRYRDNEVILPKYMTFYLSTDGFIDQTGGHKGFSFGKKRLKELIVKNSNLSLKTQKEVFLKELKKYQGNHKRKDDVTLIGFKV
jgi:serine phosphatase RsbU (regulator of sigma subunit)